MMNKQSTIRDEEPSGEFAKLQEDLRIFSAKHASQGFLKYLYYPDVRAVILYRLSRWCFMHKLKPLAYLLVNLNDLLHGVWIGPNVSAGRGLSLGHPRGLVVNPGTRIGRYCTLLNQVTCGGPHVQLGDYVELGAGARVISTPDRPVSVGNHCVVGAGAVVTRSFGDGLILAGVPARSLGSKNLARWCARHPYYGLAASDLNEPGKEA